MIKFYSNYPLTKETACEKIKHDIPPYVSYDYYSVFDSINELTDLIKNHSDGSNFVIGYNHKTNRFYLYHDED